MLNKKSNRLNHFWVTLLQKNNKKEVFRKLLTLLDVFCYYYTNKRKKHIINKSASVIMYKLSLNEPHIKQNKYLYI